MIYFVAMFKSQIMRLDYFTDLVFILNTYQCGEMGIFYGSFLVVFINTFINIS